MPAAPNNSLFTAAPIKAREIVSVPSAGLVLDDDPDAFSDWDGKPAWWTFRVPKQTWLVVDSPFIEGYEGLVQLSLYAIQDGDPISYNSLDYLEGASGDPEPMQFVEEVYPGYTYFIHMDSFENWNGTYTARFRTGRVGEWITPEPVTWTASAEAGAEIPAGSWTTLDLSTAVFGTDGGGVPYGKYEGGAIVTNTGWPDFWFPGLTLDATKTYDFEFTYATPPSGFFHNTGYVGIWGISSLTQAGYSGIWYDLFDTYYSIGMRHTAWDGTNTVGVTSIGPSLEAWASANFYHGGIKPFFESSRFNSLTGMRYRESAIQSSFQYGNFVENSVALWNLNFNVATNNSTVGSTNTASSIWTQLRGAGFATGINKSLGLGSAWQPHYTREGNDDVGAARFMSLRYGIFTMNIFPDWAFNGPTEEFWPEGAFSVLPDTSKNNNYKFYVTATDITGVDPYGGPTPSGEDTLRVDEMLYNYNLANAPQANALGLTGNRESGYVGEYNGPSIGFKQFIVYPAKATDPVPPDHGGVAPYKKGVRFNHKLEFQIVAQQRPYRYIYLDTPDINVEGAQDLGRAGFW